MRAWIKDLVGTVKSKEQVHGILNSLCEPYGEIVESDLACCTGEPGQVVYRLRMADRPAAASVADWLGTELQADNRVVLTYRAPTGFTC